MKQNIYDDPAFFEGYQNLRENEAGLNAAIEDPAIMSVLPDLKALSILDLGSGFGDFCRFARKQGAARVVGVEISKRMIAEAENRTNDSGITYLHTAVEDYAMKAKAYDLVVCRLTMHYVSDYRGVVGSVYRGLRAGGPLEIGEVGQKALGGGACLLVAGAGEAFDVGQAATDRVELQVGGLDLGSAPVRRRSADLIDEKPEVARQAAILPGQEEVEAGEAAGQEREEERAPGDGARRAAQIRFRRLFPKPHT